MDTQVEVHRDTRHGWKLDLHTKTIGELNEPTHTDHWNTEASLKFNSQNTGHQEIKKTCNPRELILTKRYWIVKEAQLFNSEVLDGYLLGSNCPWSLLHSYPFRARKTFDSGIFSRSYSVNRLGRFKKVHVVQKTSLLPVIITLSCQPDIFEERPLREDLPPPG